MKLRDTQQIILNVGDLPGGNYTFIDANGDIHQYGTASFFLSIGDDNTVGSFLVKLDGSSAAVTAVLPSASANKGRLFNFKCVDATNTVKLSSADLIDGDTEVEVFQWESITVMSNGTTWYII